MKRLILEMGMGVDLYSGDYTKAACRAVRDAIGHSSLSLFRSCGLSHREMQVKVTIGVQEPGKVDADAVSEQLPRGNPVVTLVRGGLNVEDTEHGDTMVIAAASVEAFLPVDADAWKISVPSDDG